MHKKVIHKIPSGSLAISVVSLLSIVSLVSLVRPMGLTIRYS